MFGRAVSRACENRASTTDNTDDPAKPLPPADQTGVSPSPCTNPGGAPEAVVAPAAMARKNEPDLMMGI